MARLLLSIAALLVGFSDAAFGQSSSEVAPGGKLRVGMIAITVLGGVAEPVERFVGQKLGAAVEPVMYPNPEAYLQSFGKGEWDIAIGPRVLAPADKADSTENLWAISLVYVAAPGMEFPDIASVDKAGVKIGTILGAPSDRVLTREIKAAEIVRIPLSPTIAADAAEGVPASLSWPSSMQVSTVAHAHLKGRPRPQTGACHTHYPITSSERASSIGGISRRSHPYREEGTDVGRRRLDLDHDGVFDGLQSMEDSFGVPADIARSHDEFLQTDGRFHFALHHVSDRFMRVGMKRGADSRRVVDFDESHLIALDKRLDEHIATVKRLALHGTYRHSLDLGISRFDHVRLRFLPASSQKQVPGRRGQWAASIRS